MGAITQAMAKECAARGVAVETDADVAQLLVEGGKSVGVALADRCEFRAGIVVPHLYPQPLYTKLADHCLLDYDTAHRNERSRRPRERRAGTECDSPRC